MAAGKEKTPEQKAKWNEYMKKYRRRNSWRVSEIQQQSYQKHHEERLASAKAKRDRQREEKRKKLNELINRSSNSQDE